MACCIWYLSNKKIFCYLFLKKFKFWLSYCFRSLDYKITASIQFSNYYFPIKNFIFKLV